MSTRINVELEPEIHSALKRLAEARGIKIKTLTKWIMVYGLERVEHVFDQQSMKGYLWPNSK